MLLLKVKRNRRIFSWETILRAADSVCDGLTERKFVPDMIVGIGRGGAVAAGIVAARMRQGLHEGSRIIPMSTIDRVYLKGGEVVIAGIHNLDVYRKRVLVINADTYSGETLIRADQALSLDRPQEVRTATLIMVLRDGKPPLHSVGFYGTQVPKRKDLPWRPPDYPLRQETEFSDKESVLVVLHGLVATGKTSIAEAIVKGLGYTPIYSDWYWFKYGLQNRDLDGGGVSHNHNNHMYVLCWSVIASNRNAVLDCTTRWRIFREQLLDGFSKHGVHVVFIRCSCSEESALRRIKKRTFIGPHDFGTEWEYKRVKKEYAPIDDEEFAKMNLIDVNTDSLTCSVTTVQKDSIKAVDEICEAIQRWYFQPFKKRAGA